MRRRGFTLIELMVVVVIIGILGAVIVPTVLSMAQTEGAAPPAVEARPEAPVGTPITVHKAELRIDLTTEQRLRGTRVEAWYDAAVRGRFVIEPLASSPDGAVLYFPFPEGAAGARDVQLLLGVEDGTLAEPPGVTYSEHGILWQGPLARSVPVLAEVSYRAAGRESLVCALPGEGRIGAVDVVVRHDAQAADGLVPPDALQPTGIDPGQLSWSLTGLVTDRPVVVTLPTALSPIGRVMLLCKLAGLAVMLFGAGFWYLSEEVSPGRMDDFRLGHFLLLALTYSLFFVVFAVLAWQEALPVAPAMALSAVLSLPLLALHVSRILDRRFALTRALPLAVFTLGLVVTGVYGGLWQTPVFIGAVVLTMGYLTVSWRQWTAGRAAHDAEKHAAYLRRSREAELKATAEKLTQAQEKARTLLSRAEATLDADHPDRVALQAALRPLPALRLPQDDRHERTCLQTRLVLEATLRSLTLARSKIERTLTHRRSAVHSHCLACGEPSADTPHCPHCGTARPRALPCTGCGEALSLPVHLIDPARLRGTLHCVRCGTGFAQAALL